MKMISEKLRLRKFTGLLLLAVGITFFYSCSEDDDSSIDDPQGDAQLVVKMTDAPGDYDQVLIDVQDVMIQTDSSAEEGEDEGWVSVGNVETGVYDLLTLTGGKTQLLADTDIPAGTLGQIRLVLGSNNSIVVDGESQPLSTPSAEQSGLKLQVNQELEAGEQYEFLLDFDVDQSIVSAGSEGGYSLKPVIRISATAETGVIIGEVQPSLTRSLVTAKSSSATISTYTDESGKFALQGVSEGTYQITVTPTEGSGLVEYVENNVEVSSGATIELESIFLAELEAQ